MVSIKMFGVRDEERPMAENWAKEHNVNIDKIGRASCRERV